MGDAFGPSGAPVVSFVLSKSIVRTSADRPLWASIVDKLSDCTLVSAAGYIYWAWLVATIFCRIACSCRTVSARALAPDISASA